MLTEAKDFQDESDALAALLADAPGDVFETVTQFKGWTIDDVIAHLHLWNVAAGLTLESRETFQTFFADVGKQFMAGKSHIDVQRAWLDDNADGARGERLFALWRETYPDIAASYGSADPDMRLAWAGPDMSARAAVVARQMETWAHGQEVFDGLGARRDDKDRIRNICHLGVTTYSWTFRNRGEEPPKPKPYVRLAAPSGAVWEWNEPQDDNAVTGDAVDFAQVVTQTRNIADTALNLAGPAAERWMAFAQCFAGMPETPPAKGTRFRAGANA